MKQLLFSLLICTILVPAYGQNSFDLTAKGDTINLIDNNNRRQGKWVVKAKAGKNPGYSTGQIIEEGTYKSSRKVGVWKVYFPNGNLKSEITYQSSRPKGPYTLYYENGNVQEKGNWERTKNTGDFKRYHTNGKIAQEFTFTEGGKRNGEQKYYYDNGQLRLVGTWQEGQETGEMKTYYENGDLQEIKHFNNGEIDKSKYQAYAPKTPQKDALEKQMDEGEDMNIKADQEAEKPNLGGFDGNGYAKLYNKNRQIAKDGIFKNYRLMNGKYYKYDENGILQQIMIFKNGKYIGDGVIEDKDS